MAQRDRLRQYRKLQIELKHCRRTIAASLSAVEKVTLTGYVIPVKVQ